MLGNIDVALTSPESALLLSSLYDVNNGLISNNVSELLGPVLFRESEDLLSCSKLDDLVKVYHKYDIGKFFNISITEFFDLPGWQINMLVENAELFMKDLNTDLNQIENTITNNKNVNEQALKNMG